MNYPIARTSAFPVLLSVFKQILINKVRLCLSLPGTSSVQVFPPNEKIENINDQYWTLRAEEVGISFYELD